MKTLLIVDDSTDDAEVIRMAIEEAGLPIECLVATNGLDGLQAAETWKPDLIFLDINMPVMNGIDVLMALRQLPDLWTIPTIVFSNSRNETDIRAALMAGARAYTPKFRDYEDLRDYLIAMHKFWTSSS